MADLKTLPRGTQYARPGSPVEARQDKIAREYPQRAEELDRKTGTPEKGAEGPMVKEVKSYGWRVPAPVIGAFAKMPSDVGALADVTAPALVADHTHFHAPSLIALRGRERNEETPATENEGEVPLRQGAPTATLRRTGAGRWRSAQL